VQCSNKFTVRQTNADARTEMELVASPRIIVGRSGDCSSFQFNSAGGEIVLQTISSFKNNVSYLV
jgi:hypothetical protein